MLRRAADLLSGESEDVRSRVTLVQAAGEDAVSAVGGRQFAGVLCHAVLQYLNDPLPLLSALADLACDGGVVSVVAKNQASLVMHPALAGNWSDALSAFDGRGSTCGLGVDTRADTVDELGGWLTHQGVPVAAWYGVGFFTDWWYDFGSATGNVDEKLLATELEASRRDPYRQLGRMFHLVGIREPRVTPVHR